MPYLKHIEEIDHSHIYSVVNDKLSRIDNAELVLLKGHLCIEYILNLGIERLSHVKIKDLKQRFVQKVYLLQSLGLYKNDPAEIVDTIFLINSIRNKLAHTLEFDEALLTPLFKRMDFAVKKTTEALKTKVTNAILLNGIFSFLCGHLASELQNIIVINNQYAELTNQELEDRVNEVLNKHLQQIKKGFKK